MCLKCISVKFVITYQIISTEVALAIAARGTIIAGGAGTRQTWRGGELYLEITSVSIATRKHDFLRMPRLVTITDENASLTVTRGPFVGDARYAAEIGYVIELGALCACARGVVGLR